MRQLFGHPEFWLQYCNSEEAAERVAMLFPEYYEQLLRDQADWLSPSQYRDRTRRNAVVWAATSLVRAVEGMNPVRNGRSNPLASLPAGRGDRDLQTHADEVHRLANEYVDSAPTNLAPVRPKTDDGLIVMGDRLMPQEFAALVCHTRPRDHGSLRWGPLLMPKEQARLSNFCVVGMPRSGKTTLLRLLLQSVDWRNGNDRAIVYDEKTGAPEVVFRDEAELEEYGHLLNPFDSRGVAWDIARDADTPHHAQEIARTLIPDSRKENPFYVSAPRAILAAAMTSLTAMQGQRWNLMDLLLVATTSDLDAVLDHSEHGRNVAETFFAGDSPSSYDLRKTLFATLIPLIPAAAAWDHCRERISIRDWAVNGHGVLMLGNHNAYAAAMRAVNRTLVCILVETLLDRDASEMKDTYLFLDEFQSLDYIDNLTTLLRTGPGLGVTTALGVHDLGLLKEVYGGHAEGVLAMCGHFALLRTNSTETARWASELLDEQVVRVRKKSLNQPAADDDGRGVSVTTTEDDITRPIVEPGKFFRLPLARESSGLIGYFKSPLHPTYRGALDSKVFDTTDQLQWVKPENYRLFRSDVPNFVKRPSEELVPRETWGDQRANTPEDGESQSQEDTSGDGQPRRRSTNHSVLDVDRITLDP